MGREGRVGERREGADAGEKSDSREGEGDMKRTINKQIQFALLRRAPGVDGLRCCAIPKFPVLRPNFGFKFGFFERRCGLRGLE